MTTSDLYYSGMPMIRVIILLLLPLAAPAEMVPAWLIRLPESTATAYIAETSTSTLYRFDREGGGVRKTAEIYMSIGKGGVGKTRVGDQRTPLGMYFVTEQLDTERLHEKYGATAFPLDYPNAWDRRMGRSGYGIWIHGVDPDGGERPPLDTDGCLALPNESLLAVADTFVPNATPVLIGESMLMVDVAIVEANRAALEAAVRDWATALEDGDLFAWLDAYDATFARWGMNRNEWAAFRLQTLAARQIESVDVSELLLLADPVEGRLFLSRFRLEVRETGGRRVVTTHRIYWRRAESGALKILTEDSG